MVPIDRGYRLSSLLGVIPPSLLHSVYVPLSFSVPPARSTPPFDFQSAALAFLPCALSISRAAAGACTSARARSRGRALARWLASTNIDVGLEHNLPA